MPAAERAIDRATEQTRRALDHLGREVHHARLAHGLSQAAVGAAARMAQAQVSAIERGRHRAVPVEVLGRLAAAVGLELSVRLYPAGLPVRDMAHIALLGRFRQAVGSLWRWASEVPLPIAGDKRAWDRTMTGAGMVIGIEAETRPTDMQELGRRLALKKRDGGVDRVILVLADTEWCRRLVRLNDLSEAFPVAGKVAMKAIAEGRDPGGDAIVRI